MTIHQVLKQAEEELKQMPDYSAFDAVWASSFISYQKGDITPTPQNTRQLFFDEYQASTLQMQGAVRSVPANK